MPLITSLADIDQASALAVARRSPQRVNGWSSVSEAG